MSADDGIATVCLEEFFRFPSYKKQGAIVQFCANLNTLKLEAY